jgi:pimeloyl-ACP methyl ester carboxylesterase
MQRLASDLLAVCDAIGGGPVHLVGHDWGGIQGWAFATSERVAPRLVSFTTIAGPALPHALAAIRASLRSGRLGEAWQRARRSWYILPLCLPGGPTIAWRVVLAGARWRLALTRLDRLDVGEGFPAHRVAQDGLHGANLYRANIPGRLLRRNRLAPARVPVQVIVPEGDRFISASYYDAAERVAPGLVRHSIPGSHWAQRSHPDTIAGWIREFVVAVDGAPEG